MNNELELFECAVFENFCKDYEKQMYVYNYICLFCGQDICYCEIYSSIHNTSIKKREELGI